MKKITLFLLALSTAVVTLQAQTPSATTTTTIQAEQKDIAKVLSFNEENHDFGKIPYGKPVEFTVTIKNISSDSVKIENVKVGCGCTTPKYDQGKTYAPGESFNVTLGFSGYAEGGFEKSVDILFNNGLTKQIRFHGTTYKATETAVPTTRATKN